jgi:two-component system cell cycle sensor histidine kinase/response regulator CckA
MRALLRRPAPEPNLAEDALAALPEALALVGPDGRAGFANAAFRAALGPLIPWREGEPAAALLPEAAEALGCVPATVELASGATLRLQPLPGDATLLRLEPPRAAEAPRLEILGRLAGGIAHDFNNLLALMLGATAAARTAGISDSAEAELRSIEAAAGRGAGLVRQLLAFARQQVLAPRVIELNAAVRDIAALLPRLMGDGVTLELDLEEPSRRVRVDPSQLDQVLLNLAVNARDAMEGQGRLRIATGRRLLLREERGLPPGRYAVLEVQDDGPGIPPEVVARLFEPFFTTKLESGGTGLGLATVQGIVAQSGGGIEVESAPGQGTLFRILLPRHDAPEEIPALEPPRPEPAPPGPVLLVEDEPALARLGRFALERAGHAVETAPGGEEALELLRGGLAPALLVTDVAMPGMDGLALARAARAERPSLPVLLLSGYAAHAVGADLAGEGFAFLAKPFTPDALCRAVEDALGRADSA